jgi:hypothetical protein
MQLRFGVQDSPVMYINSGCADADADGPAAKAAVRVSVHTGPLTPLHNRRRALAGLYKGTVRSQCGQPTRRGGMKTVEEVECCRQ